MKGHKYPDNYQAGEIVEYTGKGFIGFDKRNKKMMFIGRDCKSLRDCKVRYNGIDMIVRDTEIKEKQ